MSNKIKKEKNLRDMIQENQMKIIPLKMLHRAQYCEK